MLKHTVQMQRLIHKSILLKVLLLLSLHTNKKNVEPKVPPACEKLNTLNKLNRQIQFVIMMLLFSCFWLSSDLVDLTQTREKKIRHVYT